MPATVPPDQPESQPSGQSLSSSDRAERLGLLLDSLHAEIDDQEQKYIQAMAEAITYRDMFCWAVEELTVERLKRERAEQRLRQVMGSTPWHVEETA